VIGGDSGLQDGVRWQGGGGCTFLPWMRSGCLTASCCHLSLPGAPSGAGTANSICRLALAVEMNKNCMRTHYPPVVSACHACAAAAKSPLQATSCRVGTMSFRCARARSERKPQQTDDRHCDKRIIRNQYLGRTLNVDGLQDGQEMHVRCRGCYHVKVNQGAAALSGCQHINVRLPRRSWLAAGAARRFGDAAARHSAVFLLSHCYTQQLPACHHPPHGDPLVVFSRSDPASQDAPCEREPEERVDGHFLGAVEDSIVNRLCSES
jgi:hypothetical protein